MEQMMFAILFQISQISNNRINIKNMFANNVVSDKDFRSTRTKVYRNDHLYA